MPDSMAIKEYSLAICAILVAVVVRFALDSSLGNHLPYVTFFIAVAVTTWYTGLGASLMAVVLGGLASNWFFMSPRHSLAIAGVGFQVGYVTYFAVGLTIVGFGQAWRRAQQHRDRGLEALSMSESAMRERLQELQTIYDTAPMGMCLLDKDLRYVRINDRLAGMNGFPVKGHIGKTVREMVPLLADEVEPIFRRIIETGEPVIGYELTGETSAEPGVRRTWLASWYPQRDAEAKIVGLNIMVQDITDRKHTDEALHDSEERLRGFSGQLEQLVEERTRELVQSQDRLRMLATELNLTEQRERKRLAGELHDYLAQLLVVCRLNLGHVRRAGLPPKADKTIKETEEVLNQALNYSRTLMAELSPPVLQEHGLPAGLKWLAEQMERHGLKVTVDVGDAADILLPQDSAMLLYQSVRELLMNALKHAESQNVSVHLDRRDGNLRIEVHDDGVGFDLAAAAAATPTAMSSKFGLFSLRERMRALGGWFHLESAPGKGTTATLALPLSGGAASASETRATSEKSRTGESPDFQPLNFTPVPVAPLSPVPPFSRVAQDVHEEPRVRVLLVDDHAMVRQGLRSVLDSYADIEVVGEAWNGEEAVDAVEALQPAVVLMDINMPKLNGIEATARIKSRYPAITVIGLSVNAGGENEAAITKAGAALLLTKEAAVDELYQAIRACKRKSGLPARPRAKTLRTVPD
jgi:PAS domain S-box-containing protein